jgi:polyphosphate kinase
MAKKKAKKKTGKKARSVKRKRSRSLDDPKLFFNRELSWLEFNDRVLREGMDESVPLLERLKFLGIVSSNLDEFFMIRVAGLEQQRAARIRRRDIAGLTPVAQLTAIAKRVAQMVEEHSVAIQNVVSDLAKEGLEVIPPDALSDAQRQFVETLFVNDVMPVVTPLGDGNIQACPVLPGLKLYLAARLAPTETAGDEEFAILPVPDVFPRFITIPAESGVKLIRLEDVLAVNVDKIFPERGVEAMTYFRFTRDADVTVDDEEAADLLQAMEQAVRARRRTGVVRLELSAGADRRIRRWLMHWLDVPTAKLYEIDGMLDARGLWEIAERPGFDHLRYESWRPQPARDLLGEEDLFAAIQERDAMLIHPYESFDPVVHLISRAAEDPNVLAIKQTLYRTSGDSPIVAALIRAAEAGKQVVALVELKARFDEAKNVNWARRLEDAGCFVIYGIAGFKTHAKALLIVRREAHRIRRYLHLSTGNYNDKTVRLYSDIALMTADSDMTSDAAAFFNLLTGTSQSVGWNKFTIAPTGLRQRFLELIDREIQASTADRPGLIMAKVNSLQDKEICQALYRASRAGVQVKLNVRGICCLRPGVDGVSENIEVISLVDRCLEHARVFYFRNGGHEEYYLSSADWMRRNIDKRLEILFPVQQDNLRVRLRRFLDTFFSDNVKARRLRSDGTFERRKQTGRLVRAQEVLYEEAVEAAQAGERSVTRLRPLSRPKE